MTLPMLIYTGGWGNPFQTKYGRVVELVDSLDSGSSVHCGRAGSSPASRTKKNGYPIGYPFFFLLRDLKNQLQRGRALPPTGSDGSAASGR